MDKQYEYLETNYGGLIEQHEFSFPMVDKVEYQEDMVFGYFKDAMVAQFSGITDINAIKLYDKNGNIIQPVPVPLDDITKLQLAFAELLEALI